MPAYTPDRFIPAGPDFAVVSQEHVLGGFHVVSSIANWQSEIEPRYRKQGMAIYDRASKVLWSLNDDLVTTNQIAMSQAVIDAIATAEESMEILREAQARLDAAQEFSFRMTQAYIETQTRAIEASNFFEDWNLQQDHDVLAITESNAMVNRHVIAHRNELDDNFDTFGTLTDTNVDINARLVGVRNELDVEYDEMEALKQRVAALEAMLNQR